MPLKNFSRPTKGKAGKTRFGIGRKRNTRCVESIQLEIETTDKGETEVECSL
jgi:hypothetical protein